MQPCPQAEEQRCDQLTVTPYTQQGMIISPVFVALLYYTHVNFVSASAYRTSLSFKSWRLLYPSSDISHRSIMDYGWVREASGNHSNLAKICFSNKGNII